MDIKTHKYTYEVYSVPNYSSANKEFIKRNKKDYTLTALKKELKEDNYYHFRISKDKQYILFGDIDGIEHSIEFFFDKFIEFFKKSFNMELEKKDFSYSQNNKKKNSYHYSISKYNLSCKNLKIVHHALAKKYPNLKVDTTIYSDHWFRCLNQSKGSGQEGIHIKQKGKIEDFIVEYIPEYSIDINYIINNIIEVNNQKKINENKINESSHTKIIKSKAPKTEFETNAINDIQIKKTTSKNEITDISSIINQFEFYIKLFDNCFKQFRFDEYLYWIYVGMAIYNIFGPSDFGISLFDYFSKKGHNYDGFEKTKLKYLSFSFRKEDGITGATLIFYAREDNEPKLIELLYKFDCKLGPTDICKFIKLLAKNRFLYLHSHDSMYVLYCYNGKFWEKNDIILKKFISTELYDFLRYILVNIYWTSNNFNSLKKTIERLKTAQFMKELVEVYKQYGDVYSVKFDDNPYLLGFNNTIYDLNIGEFRDYNYDDYIATTTGYDWREPTDEELHTLNSLLDNIFPIKSVRKLYLEILAKGLDGNCLEKFIIANGTGRNGKGLIDDLALLALGNYGMIGNNSLLFETTKMGSNPEKANLHKKRLVIFREPSSVKKFENSIIKELTGGGSFSARGHFESNTQKELNLTMICECNKRPLLSDEPNIGERERIIDIHFMSTFTSDKNAVDPNNYIFDANLDYKKLEWQQQHKFAFMKIVMAHYTKEHLIVPDNVSNRTNNYLELSCYIIDWFKQYFELSDEKKDVIKLKDLFTFFKCTEMYNNLTKAMKLKYNKQYFVSFISSNDFFKNYFYDRFSHKSIDVFTCIIKWKIKDEYKTSFDSFL